MPKNCVNKGLGFHKKNVLAGGYIAKKTVVAGAMLLNTVVAGGYIEKKCVGRAQFII